jgi:membrane protein
VAAPAARTNAADEDGRSSTTGPSKLEQLREQHAWIDHLVRAGLRYNSRNGNHYAAAITYFSVLSLVPITMVAFAAAGFVLFFRPELLAELQAGIAKNVPAGLESVIMPIVNGAIESRNAVGIIGLLAALYSGINWMSNLRDALSAQWGQVPAAPALPKRMFFDLLTLVGLGLALLASFAITGLASGFAATLLRLVGLDDEGWVPILFTVIGVVLGLLANWLIFLWVIARLPREHATMRSAAKAAVLGAVGFEVLKQVMTYYLASVTSSPSGAIFGPLLGLLVFAYFVSRFILLVTAWAATSRENEQEEPTPVPAPAVIRPEVTVRSGPSGGTAAGLLGAGLVTGLLSSRLLLGRRRD